MKTTPSLCRLITLVASVVFALSIFLAAQSQPAADLIVRNAKVWTVDKSHPTAQAVAVLGERIVAAGSNDEIEAWHGSHTRVIDAEGKLLLPGFNDSHVHFVDGGLALDSVQLNDAISAEEFAHRIAERAKTTPKGEWVTGGDWDETKWSPARMPTKEMIDPFTPDIPVFLGRYDGHMALANSATLRLAGITAKTPDPPGGIIVRDAQGNPTGALKDAAMDYVFKVTPPLSHEQRLKAVRRALAHAAYESGIRRHRCLQRTIAARRANRAYLRRPAHPECRRSGEDRHPPFLRWSVSSHWRSQSLCRRLVGFGDGVLLRTVFQSAHKPWPAF
jgi:predicted amidohydrolase YtcJ